MAHHPRRSTRRIPPSPPSLLAALFVLLLGACSQDLREPVANDIPVLVNGELRKTWSVAELMEGRFDWLSPKENVYPAVPVTFALDPEVLGVPWERVERISFDGRHEGFVVSGDALGLLDGLLLKLDVQREGTWQVSPRGRAAERAFEELGITPHLKRLERIRLAVPQDGEPQMDPSA